MKKLFKALFPIIVIALIAVAIYFNQSFVKTQFKKAQGVFCVFQGDEAFRHMDMIKAIRHYRKGLKLYPQHYSAWYNLGNIYVAYEDYYSALYAYSQAFKYNPKMMTARMNYGVVASDKLGDFDIAIEQFDTITKTKRKIISIPTIFSNKYSTKENKAIAYYNMGLAYRMKSLYSSDNWEKQRRYLSKAIQSYQKSIKISPKRYDTWFNLGFAYHISDNYLEAGRCYCQAIKLNPYGYEAHFNLAVLLRHMRHYKESYDEIEKASILVTSLDDNPAAQQYVAIVMNDITRSLYQNEQYSKQLEQYSKTEKSQNEELVDAKKKPLFRFKLFSKSKNKNRVKKVSSKDEDKVLLQSFGACPSIEYFTYSEDDED